MASYPHSVGGIDIDLIADKVVELCFLSRYVAYRLFELDTAIR